jgi:hypothetical protein
LDTEDYADMDAARIDLTRIFVPADPARPKTAVPTLIAYLGDLDTYRLGPAWHTIWHKDALPHGLDVDAFRSLGGGGLEVGQRLALQADGGGFLNCKVKGIRIIDPAQARRDVIEAVSYDTGRAARGSASGAARCWLVTLERE